MRNLMQYPITKQEILLHLGAERGANDSEITGLVGDMRPLYLEHIISIVIAAFELCDGFERRMSERGMGFVVPFPEATKLMQACKLDEKSED